MLYRAEVIGRRDPNFLGNSLILLE